MYSKCLHIQKCFQTAGFASYSTLEKEKQRSCCPVLQPADRQQNLINTVGENATPTETFPGILSKRTLNCRNGWNILEVF